MKDQKRLLHKCLMNDIPAFVLCGTDALALKALKAYHEIAVKEGCTTEFTDDLVDLIRDFEIYQSDEPETVKLPD